MSKQSLKYKTTVGIFWSFVERSLVQLVQLVISVVMARLLLPDDYGLIGMLIVFTALSALFVDGGFTQALIQKKDRTEVDYSTVFFFNLLVSILCYGLLYISAPFIASFYHSPVLTSIIRILFISLIINSFCIIQQAKLTIEMDFKTKAIVSLVSVLISGIIGVLMAYKGYGVWALVGQTLCGSLINLILLYAFYRWRPLPVFSKQSFRQLFGFGSRLLGAGTVSTIVNNLYPILIGRFLSASQVGYYTRGMQLPTMVSTTVSSVLQGVTYPVMTSVQDDRERLTSIYRRLLQTTGFFIIPLMTTMAILSGPFVRYFLTEKWAPAIILMQWICFARLFTPLSSLNMNILNAIGRSDLFLKVDLSKLPMTLIALVITVPMGLTAVVIGHFVTSFIAFFINAYFPGKLFGYGAMDQLKDLIPVLICCGIMAVVLVLISYTVPSDLLKMIISLVLGSLAYYFSASALKIEEIKEVNSTIEKLWNKVK